MDDVVRHIPINCTEGSARCLGCSIRHRSLCSALDDFEISALEAIVRDVEYAPGRYLFFQDDRPSRVFTLRSGTVQLFRLLVDGRRQILRFHGPGKLIGYSGSAVHDHGAEAVTPVVACEIPLKALRELGESYPNLERKLREILAGELATAQSMLVTLGRKSAKERIATFLLQQYADSHADSHAENVDGAGTVVRCIALPMTRADIADNLGLTAETVSRMLTEFVKDGTITIPRADRVTIERYEVLRRLANA